MRSLWPRLMALSSGKPWPPSEEPEARRFIETVISNDLFPLLFDDRDLPSSVREAADQYAALALLHQQRSKTFEALFSDLATALEGERFAVLKGMDYAYRLYARPCHRPFRDIDILVPRSRVTEISRRLVAAGWIETPPSTAVARLESHHERGFRREGITVDLHNRFVQRPRHEVDYDAIWSRVVPMTVAGVQTLRLSDTDALLYQALSIAIHNMNVPIIRLLDLERMITSETLAVAAEEAKRWRIRHAFFAAIWQTQVVFPEVSTADVEAVLDGVWSPRRRRFFELAVLTSALKSVSRRAPTSRTMQLWRKMALIDDTQHRIGFGLYFLYANVTSRLGGRWRSL